MYLYNICLVPKSVIGIYTMIEKCVSNREINITTEITRIFKENRTKYLNFINQRLNNHEESEDVLHDVFVNLLTYVKVNKNEIFIENLNSWIFTAIRNRIIDLYRKKRAIVFSNLNINNTSQDENDSISYADIISDIEHSPDIILFRKTIYDTIMEEIKQLPEEQRFVFERNEFDGIPFKVISEETGINVNTLLARKHYAIMRLRNRLKKLYDSI